MHESAVAVPAAIAGNSDRITHLGEGRRPHPEEVSRARLLIQRARLPRQGRTLVTIILCRRDGQFCRHFTDAIPWQASLEFCCHVALPAAFKPCQHASPHPLPDESISTTNPGSNPSFSNSPCQFMYPRGLHTTRQQPTL